MSISIFTNHYREWAKLWIAVSIIENGERPDPLDTECAYYRCTGRATLKDGGSKQDLAYWKRKPE